MGSLRSIAAGQEQFQKGNIVDQNADGIGEFGWLGELSGVDPCRTIGVRMSTSPYIAAILGVKDLHGQPQKSGFYYRMYLQGPDGGWMGERYVKPQLDPYDESEPERFPEQEAAAPYQEKRWICYAWPNSHTHSGDQAFVVNEAGEVWATEYEEGIGEGGPYDGADHGPRAMAAFVADGSRIANGDGDERGQDGRLWVKVR